MKIIKTLPLAVRLLGGFIAVSLICFLVGATSYFFSKKAQTALQNVSKLNEEKGNLNQLLNDHYQWRDGLQATLMQNLDSVSVQVDGHLCGYGKWYYSEAFQDFKRICPECADVIDSMAETHLALHTTAEHIDRIWVQGNENLVEELQARLLDHFRWSQSVASSIQSGSRISVETNPALCAFGKHLAADENQKLMKESAEYREKMNQVIPLHDALH